MMLKHPFVMPYCGGSQIELAKYLNVSTFN
jgi:hypothetical protein